MPDLWHRYNISIGTRVCVLLILLAAILVGTFSDPETAVGDATGAIDELTDRTAIRVDVSTHTARAGQRIGVRITAESRKTGRSDVTLLLNGNAAATQPLPASGSTQFEVEVPDNGPLLLGAELRTAPGGELLAENATAALVNVASIPAVLVIRSRPSAYAASLRLGGWPVTEIRPDELATNAVTLDAASLLVLDDIAIADLPQFIWTAIDDAVRITGMGLLVLGGPNAFALGAYRDSKLETILPVISEPPDYEPPASLLFLMDVSGSMDRPAATGSRLQIARQAAIATAHGLRPVDRVGLVSFDTEFREHLPTVARADHGAAIERAWPTTASGGTRLLPALASAIEQLEQDSNSHHILVILTDGKVTQPDLTAIAAALQATAVEVIALVLADSTDRKADALLQIFAANGARAARVDNVLLLPALMRSAVAKTRPAVVAEPSALTVAAGAGGWLRNITLPSIEQYALTRARNAATVQISSDRGDVIVASIYAGAGEVIAVSSGFSSWTPAWLQSADWPLFATNLTRRLATRDSRDLIVNLNKDGAGNMLLVVDKGNQLASSRVHATLVNPSGTATTLDLQADAPGRFSTPLPLLEAGQYLVSLRSGISSTRYQFLYEPQHAVASSPSPKAVSGDQASMRSRWIVALALLLFVAILVWERR